jgi:hypothetical protein
MLTVFPEVALNDPVTTQCAAMALKMCGSLHNIANRFFGIRQMEEKQ